MEDSFALRSELLAGKNLTTSPAYKASPVSIRHYCLNYVVMINMGSILDVVVSVEYITGIQSSNQRVYQTASDLCLANTRRPYVLAFHHRTSIIIVYVYWGFEHPSKDWTRIYEILFESSDRNICMCGNHQTFNIHLHYLP